MTYDSAPGLAIKLDDGTLRLRLDRAEKRNAVTDEMVDGLIVALDAAGKDENVRVIVLSAAGDHFCGGFDIVARNRETPGPRPRVGSIQRRLPSAAHRLIPLMLSVQTPIVCRVQGWVAGIGLHLALAADFTVAAEDAQLWEPFTERGFTPDSGGSWLLPRRIGELRAREMLLLGRRVSGREAAEWGLVHRAVPASQMDGAVEDVTDRLAKAPTVAVGLAKWLLHTGASAKLDDQLRNEAFALELSSRSEDFREGLAAFAEKREPKFRGR